MGLLLATMLSSGGLEVVLACRRAEQAEVIREKGVVVEAHGGQWSAKIPAATPEALPRYNYDIAVVAVKAYDAATAAVEAKHLLRRSGVAVSIQNGLGAFEEIASTIGLERTLYMGLYIGARRIADNRVEYTGGRKAVIGPIAVEMGETLEKTGELLAQALRASNVEAVLVEDAEPWRWDKLVVNAAINPVTAILGVINKAVYDNPYAREVAEAAAREAGIVAERRGVKLPRDPVRAVEETARATSSNKSSMLQDIEARRRTEVDYINGAIVQLGLEEGVYTPVNYTLYLEVKALEKALGITE